MSIQHITAEAPKMNEVGENLNSVDLLANVSHEIRNPLNAIIGLSNLLKTAPCGEEKEEYLSGLIQTSETLLEIVNNIMDFSKLNSGRLAFDKNVVDLAKTIPQRLYGQKIMAEGKGLQFSLDFDPEIPSQVVLDSVKVNQVIINLVSNAIKFTDKGRIRFSVKVLKKTSIEVLLRFSVEDTGTGIPEEELKNIFKPFNQGNEKINSRYGGTGLGLTISKKLIEMMGGSLQVQSEYGKGTEFYFDFCFPISNSAPETLKSFDELLPKEGLKVLVVDDNKLNRLVARKTLEQWKVSCITAANGIVALQLIEKQNFDLVLMDLRMPELDGHETIKKLRELKGEKYKRLPVVAVTGSLNNKEQDELVMEGFTDYLLKPYQPNQLLKKLLFLFPE